jgi:type III secretory pathway component EscV
VISYKLTRGAPYLEAHRLDGVIEEAVLAGITHKPNGSFLILPPAQQREIVGAVRHAVSVHKASSNDAAARPSVLVVRPEVRRFVRQLIAPDLPDVIVTSFAELDAEITLGDAGKVTLGQAA